MNRLYFDRDCGFCSRCVAFLQRGSKAHRLEFVALQEAQEWLHAHPEWARVDSLLFEQNEAVVAHSEAVIRALQMSRSKAWGLLRLVPLSWRDAVYRWVAKNRYRLFGSGSCELPN